MIKNIYMYYLDICKRIYQSSPDWIKAPVGWLPLSLVLGRHYRRQKKLLAQSASWDQEKLLSYQKNALFDMVEYAATSTQFYRDLFKKSGLPAKLESMEQFCQIPLIDKQEVKKLGKAVFSDTLPASQRYKVSTGGTSGSPLSFYMSNEAYAREWAFVHDLLSRYGIKPDDRKLSIRGVPISRGSGRKYIQYNPVYKELQVSPFHITEQIINREVDKIISFKPVYLHGYPSALELLAKLARANNWGGKLNLKGVLAISENLFPGQKELIEDAFCCEVFSFYGHSERLIFAGNWPGKRGYVIDPRYGFTEIINNELVGTGFINKATPLLRYKTGDMATIMEHGDGSGLLAMPRIEKVEGRWRQEIIIGKTGSRISITALNMHSDVFENVERFQFYQDTRGEVELRIVPMEAYSKSKDEQSIVKGLKEKVGDELDIEIVLLDSIELTGREKQLFLIQKLKLDN